MSGSGANLNQLWCGDMLAVMRQLPAATLDLVYLDPPFASGRNYQAVCAGTQTVHSFGDTWAQGLPGYLAWLTPRLREIPRLLKPRGSLFVHLDWHASHYVKVGLDRIFGADAFCNEIIWHYESGGRARRTYARKHDVILWYAQGPPRFYPEAIGVPRTQCPACQQERRQWNHLRKHTDADGRTYRSITSAGKEYRYYDDEPVPPPDVWVDIPHLQQRAPERLGYPTQKPEALLERIILGSTRPGDTVADFCAGSGTTVAVAQRLGRRWVAGDSSPAAVERVRQRLGGTTTVQQAG